MNLQSKIALTTLASGSAAFAYHHDAEAFEHTIKYGESLWSISNQYNITIDQLKSYNKLTSNLIFPDQQLKIPIINQQFNQNIKKNIIKQQSIITKNSQKQLDDYYIVQPGDSVYKISNQFGLTMNQLKQINNLKSNLIFPNQRLKIKLHDKIVENQTSQNAPVKILSISDKYTIQPGDSLGLIAEKFDLSVDKLKKINRLSSDLIYPNQQLIINYNSKNINQINNSQNNESQPNQIIYNHQNLYDYGQCTWYVFNKRASINKNISTYWGNANMWSIKAQKDGYLINHQPKVGSIGQTVKGPLGHVFFVERLNDDGSILISETNYLTPPAIVGYRTIWPIEYQNYDFIH